MSPIDNLSGLPRHDDMEDVIVNPAEHYFDFTEDYNINNFQFKVVPTPGHSIGGVSFIFDREETVFSGDALFKETIGRWDLPSGNHEQLLTSIQEQLLHFLTTTKFSQDMDGIPLLVTRRSLTHIFHKNKSLSYLL